MPGELERGRECYAQRKWADAYDSLSRADQAGRDEDYLSALERAHQTYLDASEGVRAVRCAFWLGLRLLFRGETGRATGWLARARRLLERETHECPERGYLLLPVVEQQLAAGDCEAAYATAASAAEIGERCGDADLIACARHQQGRTRLQQGEVERGLALLDEVMVAVTAGELSSLVTGLMYCSVIQACQEVYAFGRAREWTAALARWPYYLILPSSGDLASWTSAEAGAPRRHRSLGTSSSRKPSASRRRRRTRFSGYARPRLPNSPSSRSRRDAGCLPRQGCKLAGAGGGLLGALRMECLRGYSGRCPSRQAEMSEDLGDHGGGFDGGDDF